MAAGFPCGSDGKESTCSAGDLGSILGSGRSPGEGKGYPLQYSGMENSMDCIVHRVTKSQTLLSDFHFLFLSALEMMIKGIWWKGHQSLSLPFYITRKLQHRLLVGDGTSYKVICSARPKPQHLDNLAQGKVFNQLRSFSRDFIVYLFSPLILYSSS